MSFVKFENTRLSSSGSFHSSEVRKTQSTASDENQDGQVVSPGRLLSKQRWRNPLMRVTGTLRRLGAAAGN